MEIRFDWRLILASVLDDENIFSDPIYDPPDPCSILPPHLVNWATIEE